MPAQPGDPDRALSRRGAATGTRFKLFTIDENGQPLSSTIRTFLDNNTMINEVGRITFHRVDCARRSSAELSRLRGGSRSRKTWTIYGQTPAVWPQETPMRDYLKFYINGEWVDPVTPRTLDVQNPATEEAYARISIGSKADVDKAVAAAKAAFPAFAATTKEYRADLLDKIIAVYKKRLGDMAGAISEEMGAPMLAVAGRAGPVGPRPPHAGRQLPPHLRVRRAPRQAPDPERADRRLRLHHAVELAAEPDRLQGRARHRRRLHHGAEAVRDRADRRDHLRRDPA